MSDLEVIYSQATSPNTFTASPESKHESHTVTHIFVHVSVPVSLLTLNYTTNTNPPLCEFTIN